MAAGGVLVATLVGWALTRTVEPAPKPAAEMPAAVADPLANPVTAGLDTAGLANTTPTSHEDAKSVPRIAVEDLYAKHNRGEVIVIDVRDAMAFASSHIPGSLNIPFSTVESRIAELPKDKPIVTYCT